MTKASHWDKHVSQWQHIGPPLRPSPQDIHLMEGIVRDHAHGTTPLRVLMLGVTPEIARMRWPDGTRLLAADRHPGMIRTVWPGHEGIACADWGHLPFADATFDIIIGDGCFTQFGSPQSYRQQLRELHRLLAPDGLFIMRFFLRPDACESPEQVFTELAAGRIGSFHAFKWRLAQALHGTLNEGIVLASIWSAWQHAGIDARALAAQTGWSPDAIATIDAYRDAPGIYTFPTLAELRALLSDRFRETGCHYGDYELGERCPVIACHPDTTSPHA